MNHNIFPGLPRGKQLIYIETHPMGRGKISTRRLKEIVCGYFSMDFDYAFSKTRKRECVRTRQWYAFFARMYLKMTYDEIGMSLGGLDHATILHAEKVIKNEIERYKESEDDYKKINRIILRE